MGKRYCNNPGKIENQGRKNFCSAYSITSYLSAYFARIYGFTTEFSILYVMKNAKDHDRNNSSTGTYVDCAMEQVLTDGCCEEALYPIDFDKDYFDNKFPVIPKEALTNAMCYKPFKLKKLQKITVENLKDLIDNNSGCILALNVFESYFDSYKDVFMRKPHPKDPHVVGRHATYMCGYDDDLKCCYGGEEYTGFFTIAESFGEKGITRGYKKLPYKFITDHVTGLYSSDRLVDDVYYFEYESVPKYNDYHDDFVNTLTEPIRKITFDLINHTASYNNHPLITETFPLMINGRTYLPLRLIGDLFEASVNYFSESQKITLYSKEPNYVIECFINNTTITKYTPSGKTEIICDAPPFIKNGSTYVPVRAISEVLNCKVDYKDGVITITGTY